MLGFGHYKDMDAITTAAALKKACRYQGNMMPVGEYIMVTRWGWNYDRNEMGFEAHIFRYTSKDRTSQAPIAHVAYSAADHEDFTNQAEAGAWALAMITATY